jgi:hypothetical protein
VVGEYGRMEESLLRNTKRVVDIMRLCFALLYGRIPYIPMDGKDGL